MYHCIEHCLSVYTPHEKVSSDSKSFLIPGLPDKTEMKRSQLPENIIKTNPEGPYWEMLKKIKESEHRSYAMIHDTIYDLESSYAELYQTIKGKKPWLIGPLFHFSKREEASNSKDIAVQEQHICLSWLDSQEPNSVVYICFGKQFYNEKLVEILGCGVGVGAEVWHISFDVKDTIVKKEKIEANLKMLMNTSRESEEIGSRAKDVK
ncbi:putative low-temperature-induced cysteine proteinase-like [Capsicum annuum]|nr:putative low-temperature-induced cysteine proteinase-like [Capsicum annuum]